MQLRWASDEVLRPRFDSRLPGKDPACPKRCSSRPPSSAKTAAASASTWAAGSRRARLAHRHDRGRRASHRKAHDARGSSACWRTPKSPSRSISSRISCRRRSRASPPRSAPSSPPQPGRRRHRSVADVPHARGRLAHRGARAALRRVRRDGDRGPRRRHVAAGGRPAAGGGEERALHPRQHRRAAAGRGARRGSASTPTKTGKGLLASGDDAISSGPRASAALPDDWDLFVPEDLVDTQVRHKPIGAFATRLERAWTGSSSSSRSRAEGVAVTRDELARCLAEGQQVRAPRGRLVRAFDPTKVQRDARSRGRDPRPAAGKGGKLPLSQAGRVQELLQHVGERERRRRRARALPEAQQHRGDRASPRSRATSRRRCAPTRRRASRGSSSSTTSARAASSPTTWVSARRCRPSRCSCSRVKQETRRGSRALIVAPTSVVTNWERELDKFAPVAQRVALWHGADRKEQADELEGRRRRDHQLRAAPPRRGVPREARPPLRHPRRGAEHQEPDERHRAPRPSGSRRSAASRSPARRSRTASREIWSIFDFVSPGPARPARQVRGALRAAHRGAATTRRPQRLRATIHPFILRRTKAEVAKDLPEKIETDQICDLDRRAAALYAPGRCARCARRSSARSSSVGLAKSQIQILAGLTRLRQVACDPRLLGLPREFTDEDSRQARRAPRARRKTRSRAATACSSSASS